ncbi:MAG: hypothetical protein ACLSFZ_09700 [Frisingicoccus sp.]
MELGGSKAKGKSGNIYLKLGDLTTAEEKLQKALDKGGFSQSWSGGTQHTETPADYTLACQYYETIWRSYGQCRPIMTMDWYDNGRLCESRSHLYSGRALNNRLLDRMISKIRFPRLSGQVTGKKHWNTLMSI